MIPSSQWMVGWMIASVAFLTFVTVPMSARSQAGMACSGTVCGLGGQLRAQVGNGAPLPVSFAPGPGNQGDPTPFPFSPFTRVTILFAPLTSMALPLVGKGLGAPGQIKPTPSATLMQTTGPAPRALTFAPAVFGYDRPPISLRLINFQENLFAFQSNLDFDIPHPGTTRLGASAKTIEGGAIPTSMANRLSAGGRVGAPTVTFYANATTLGPGSPTNNFGSPSVDPTAMAGEAGVRNINGLARFTATSNQFGGQMIARTTGTARIYFNSAPLVPATDLPCKVSATPLEGTSQMGVFVPFNTGTDCLFGLSIVDYTASDATVGVAGGAFGGVATAPAFMATQGVFTGTIGFNGTILGQGAPVTMLGANLPFTGQGRQTVGFPLTTGRLSITVTDVVGSGSEMFVRSGTDARTANGNGVVALVTGSMTARDISGGNANRTWITLEIPEPSSIIAAVASLLALFGCHRFGRRGS